MDILLLGLGKVIVDNKMDLLDIDTSSEEIGGDKDTWRTGSEFFHDEISLVGFHGGMDGRDGEVLFFHCFGKVVNWGLGVAIDDTLLDF